MKRKLITAVASISLLMGGFNFAGGNEVHAESLKDKINDVKEKREANKSAQQKAEDKLDEIKSNQEAVEAELQQLDQKMVKTEAEIAAKEKEITKTKEDIEKLKAEIAATIKRIEERDKMLKDRVTAMYENGGSVQYIEVLLGSKSFGDFLDRVFALNEIAEQDKQILEAHKADKKALEEMKAEVEKELATLEEQMKELEALKASLKQQVERKNALMSKLKEQEKQMHAEMAELEDQADLLAKQQAAFEAEKRRAEEAARKAAAEEAARKAAAAKSGSSDGGSSVSSPAVTGGMFMRPSNAPQTSPFGPRWGRMHAGIDLARGGTVPVVASASGTVIKSYKSSSYGNVIFVAHYINGQTYTSVYAHLRSRNVGNGATVQKGQQIGIMGNTGNSTGQHLHFEIHKGSWNQSKSNAINPRRFF